MSACPQCHYPLSDVVTFCVECGFAADDGNPTDPWNGRMIAERFRLVSKLGAGGMGEVYRVRDRELGRTVAMKVLRPRLLRSAKALTRFREEAMVSGQLCAHRTTLC